MREELDRRWQQAQLHEARGALDAARAEYDAILALAPRQPMVRLRLSEIAERQGAYRDARREAHAAAELVRITRAWNALPFVTLRLLAFDDRDLVRDLIAGADWADPAVLAQSPVLSQHLWLIDAPEVALRLIGAAMQRARPHPLLSYSRANALRYAGRMEEATAEFERAITLAPENPLAHWSLAYHARAGEPGGRVDRIRRALENASDPMARAHLHYALFRELDHAGDTDAAWRELESGARLMRGQLRYDAAAEAASTDALLRLGEAPASNDDASVPRPVFVVGMPRTGTTVLERILGNHSQVASAGELNAFQHALAHAADTFVRTPVPAAMIDRVASADFDEVGRAYMARTLSRYEGGTHLVDKTPSNVFHAWFIARALPRARVLCLVRDPVDACFSNFKELFGGDAYAYSYDLGELAGHASRFGELVAHWERTLPERFMTVSYEALVSDPATTAEAVMRFCGLPFESQAVDITGNLSPSSTASSSQVREPIHTRGIGAWRRYERQLQPLVEGLRTHGAIP